MDGLPAATDPPNKARYLVVSVDGHAGPTLKEDLRPYCPARYLEDFDAFSAEVDRTLAAGETNKELAVGLPFAFGGDEANIRSKTCPGLRDPIARRRDMDADGIAADVIFAGGGNDQPLPFLGLGASAGPENIAGDLRALGGQIWNEWLADYISGAPDRHVGVMQVPIWDINASIRMLERGRAAGLRAANFPASRPDFPAYNDPIYDPFWSACEDLEISLMTHTGGGAPGPGASGPGGFAIAISDGHVRTTSSLPQLIFGGVFERHSRLSVFYTELRVSWVPELLRNMDSIYFSDSTPPSHCELISRPPSDYWREHCFNGASFLAPFEVAMRDEIGIRNLLWGADYPHTEGTWPRTLLSLRNTFADVPEEESRLILGESAVEALRLDRVALRSIADSIGPLPSEIGTPLAPEELPERPGLAFRRIGAFA